MSGGLIHPLTPFTSWGCAPPYQTEDTGRFRFAALVLPVRSKSGLATSDKGGMVHVAEIASICRDGRIQYGARWACSGGTNNATLVNSTASFGDLCARCDDIGRGPGLYRCWNAAGDLLYIGSTGTPASRFQSHKTQSPWWPEVATVRVERYPTVPQARAAERMAIVAENPLYNVLMRKPASGVQVEEAAGAAP